MRYYIFILLVGLFAQCTESDANDKEDKQEVKKETVAIEDMNHQQLGKALLIAVANDDDYQEIQSRLANTKADNLAAELDTDTKRKAFWMNVYNAYVNITLAENPSLWEDRGKFFGEDRFVIAGEELSFDEVEHGIIRSSSIKLSAGYLSKPFTLGYEKKMKTEEVDPRIHFGINCGAKDCPPVHLLEPTSFDDELDQMTKNYLQKWTTYDAQADTVATTALMSWFRGDFGGKDGGIKFLKQYDVIPNDVGEPELNFKPYDWTKKIGVFSTDAIQATVS